MRKIVIFSALTISLASCGGSGSTDSNTVRSDTGQSGMNHSSAIDTSKHPDGMINGSVISTDTAAINMQNSVNKAKQAKKNK